MRIHSTEWIIQEVDVTVLIDGPCQTHSLFLTPTQVDTLGGTVVLKKRGHNHVRKWTHLLSDLSHVLPRKDVQVRCEGTGLNSPPILHVVHGLPKENVILESGILDPGLLGHVSHAALYKVVNHNTHEKVSKMHVHACTYIVDPH